MRALRYAVGVESPPPELLKIPGPGKEMLPENNTFAAAQLLLKNICRQSLTYHHQSMTATITYTLVLAVIFLGRKALHLLDDQDN